MRYILCQIAGETYGIPIDHVQSIERPSRFTRVPGTRAFVKGLMNLRGVVTPVMDLGVFLGLGEVARSARTRIVVAAEEDVVVGLLVESAHEVVEIPDEALESVDEAVVTGRSRALRSLANLNGTPVGILDLRYVLDPDLGLSSRRSATAESHR
jgi:purine-binding chemotaxis protein CheW